MAVTIHSSQAMHTESQRRILVTGFAKGFDDMVGVDRNGDGRFVDSHSKKHKFIHSDISIRLISKNPELYSYVINIIYNAVDENNAVDVKGRHRAGNGTVTVTITNYPSPTAPEDHPTTCLSSSVVTP